MATTPNVQWQVSQGVRGALEASRADEKEFLTKYVDAKRRTAELEALCDVGVAMGFVDSTEVQPIREAASG